MLILYPNERMGWSCCTGRKHLKYATKMCLLQHDPEIHLNMQDGCQQTWATKYVQEQRWLTDVQKPVVGRAMKDRHFLSVTVCCFAKEQNQQIKTWKTRHDLETYGRNTSNFQLTRMEDKLVAQFMVNSLSKFHSCNLFQLRVYHI